jgi:dTDP-4-dehydrorhamnose reductase
MKVIITGGTGFVGSNIVRVFRERHGAEVLVPVYNNRPTDAAYACRPCDLTDTAAVHAMVEGFGPDVIVHSAIPNDYDVMYADRHATWAGYVGATRNLVDAANAAGAKIILVSTDWVFDGTQAPADETTPPNPVNLYGVMKMASEIVLAERADDGAVARVSGVNGVHWARPTTIRAQDPGYGYFVGSIVDALRAGQRFLVWEDDRINMRATPSLATECAEMMWRIATRDRTGIFHCCGADSVSRRELAFAACDIFELDADLLDFGPPDADVMAGAPIPHDTSLDATATAAALDYGLPSLTELLTKFRDHLDQGVLS